MSTPIPDPHAPPPEDRPRFVHWTGFLLVGMLVNGLFLLGMWDAAADPAAGVWVKTLSWLPFNLIASAFYYVCHIKLDVAVFKAVALAMIAANWIIFFAA